MFSFETSLRRRHCETQPFFFIQLPIKEAVQFGLQGGGLVRAEIFPLREGVKLNAVLEEEEPKPSEEIEAPEILTLA